ncbi:protein DEK [Lingula anatina]|uniref:Protein DEK n=1 Tax=Lingula anatina TaxID=7574 RepID=A0A1S3K379_LINAN|nr:protein DEK [Lingula anatina]|eukprot:XP_013417083.1 protein DEK [Lingula anatina]
MSDTELGASSTLGAGDQPVQNQKDRIDKEKNEEERVDGEQKEEKQTPKKSAKKSPKKVEKKEQNDESDEGDEEELGLLERPVIIESGKRERKKTERLEATLSVTPKDKKVEIKEGVGIKLGACVRIEHFLNKTKSEELKPLHRILYNRVGSASEIKKNIRQFSGFPFESDSTEFEKKVASLNKYHIPVLKLICEVLDLEKSGAKDTIVTRIMDFLMNPKDSGRAPPAPKKRKSSGKKEGKGKRKRKSGEKKKENNEDADDEDDDDDEISDEEEDEEEEEEEKPKKKQKVEKTPKKTPQKKPKKEPAKPKKSPLKKATPKKKKAPVSTDSDEDSSDDEPLMKKPKGPPVDEELKDVIKKILDGANLEEVTMKTVCKQVYAKYPEFDLTDRKDFIKATVRQIIS